MRLRSGCTFCNSRGISTPPDVTSGGDTLLVLIILILLPLLQGYLLDACLTGCLLVGQLTLQMSYLVLLLSLVEMTRYRWALV
jgi:hypothetical protein